MPMVLLVQTNLEKYTQSWLGVGIQLQQHPSIYSPCLFGSLHCLVSWFVTIYNEYNTDFWFCIGVHDQAKYFC